MSTWVKVYNSLPAHPKTLAANAGMPCSPGWLYVCGLCYSNEHLTDGFIPTHVLGALAPGTTKCVAAVKRLVESAQWHVVDGGWLIHDYGEHQRSAGEIRDRRASDAERKASVRKKSRRTPHGQVEESAKSPSGVQAVEGREQKAEGREEVKALSAAPTEVVQVFEAWVLSTERTSRTELSPQRRRVISNALKLYPLADLLDAVDGWRFSAHHRGENDRGEIYNDIELLLKSSKQVEKFRDLKRGAPHLTANVVQLNRRETVSDLLRDLDASENFIESTAIEDEESA